MKRFFHNAVTVFMVVAMTACTKPGVVVVDVTGVELDKETLSITAGDKVELTFTVSPTNAYNKKVTWKSSAEKVATVNDGIVTALAEGSATITVTTDDGGKSDHCEVTIRPVAPPDNSVTGVELDRETLAIAIGEKSPLRANIIPADADDPNVSWSSSNETVATVGNDGTVTGKGAGTAAITVTTNDGGFKTSATVIVEGMLINGVVWAEFNVGMPGKFVAAAEESGMLYKWGSKVGWNRTDPIKDSNGGTAWDNGMVEGAMWPETDNPCPAGWRVPNAEEIQKLVFDNLEGMNNKVARIYMARGAVNGALFTDRELGTSIFLPAAGYRIASNGNLSGLDQTGFYWSSQSVEKSTTEAHRHYFNQSVDDSGKVDTTFDPLAVMLHSFALSIRCVK